jgi:DNA excision repair protein ERCC-4
MDFRIVIDTREQAPWDFDCPTVRRKLDAGDYSVDGLEDVVAVERKSLKDFVSTVIHDFPRFAAELEQLAGHEAACVVVEAELDDVLRGRAADDLRGAAPESVLGAAVHITLRYGVPVFWCGRRQAARAFTDAYLRMFVRTRHERERREST